MKNCLLIICLLISICNPNSLSDFGFNNQIELINDMSNTCIDELYTNMYLTFGMGVSDAVVIIISDNDLYPNCEIMFYTAGGNNSVYLIVVIEFPDHTEGPNNACQDSNSNIYIGEPSFSADINVCNEVNKLRFGYFSTPVYGIISSAKNVSVKIVTKSLFETVKITATSARRLNQYEGCDKIREVPCMIANFSVCISRELLCDENINCGQSANNDEDVRICDEGRYRRLWLVVLGGTIMILIIVFFLIHLLRTCLPSVPDSFFIFNEDEDNKLILSTVFTHAPESLREPMLTPKLQQQSSIFKFKSVPVTNLQPTERTPPAAKTYKKPRPYAKGEKRSSLDSDDYEVELESHLYKQDGQKNNEDLAGQKLTKTGKPKQVGEVKSVYTTRQVPSKRPRFQQDIIHIMDYIDQQSSPELTDEDQIPLKEKEKQKKSSRKDSTGQKSNIKDKRDRLEKHRRSSLN